MLLTACGKPGAPLPPSLQLAIPPQDVTATRKGDVVTLTWTPPAQTTDGQNIRGKFAGASFVCRAIDHKPMQTCQYAVGNLPASIPSAPRKGERKAPAPPKVEFADRLPLSLQQQNPTRFAEYAVEATNYLRRSAGLSNQIKVPLAPTLVPPDRLEQRVTPEGITVSFGCPAANEIRGIAYAAHLYRRDPAGAVSDAGFQALPPNGSGECTIADTNFEWEKSYTYWVAVVTSVSRGGRELARVEGNDSPSVTVFAHDVFPPAVPEDVEAVASGVGQKPFIDLTWSPNTDPDLEGYHVYRQEPGTANWIKLTPDPLKSPAFRDERAVPGTTYNYAVSAIDVRGNESQRSAPASETVP